MNTVFSYGLQVKEFSDIYHTHITVEAFKGEVRSGRFQRLNNYTPRDLMVEGSGFLQWLTVLALTLDPKITMVLLDEPDAHLHPALQEELLSELREIATQFEKQVLYSTHSAELIKCEDHTRILDCNNQRPCYLNIRDQKISLLAGIGSEYTPRFADIEKHKRILFVENESDANILKKAATKLGRSLSETFVVWPWASGHKERKYIHLELRKLFPTLVSISLVDRDHQTIESVDAHLRDKQYGDDNVNSFFPRKWRRRHIEGYLLHPDAIARATKKSSQEIISHIAQHFALDISGRIVDQSEPELLLQANGKDILEENTHSIKNDFHADKFDILEQMDAAEVPEDINKLRVDSVIDGPRDTVSDG